MAERRPRCVPVRNRDTRTAKYNSLDKDDLQLGKLKENCFLLKLYRKLRIMFLSPRRESHS